MARISTGLVTPAPTTEPDPFAPDVSMWPEAPPWLFPTTMVILAVLAVVVVVMLGLWIKAVRVQRAERAARQPEVWVDLSKLDKKGRWKDE
jgi:hypothetical protein